MDRPIMSGWTREGDSIMRDIIKHFGNENQLEKAIEELNELIEAIKEKNPDHILEELADCIIMIKQTQIIYGFSNDQIDAEITRKLERTRQRIKDTITITKEESNG